MKKLKTFLLYAEASSQVDLLDDEEAGQLFKALFHYVSDGTELVTRNRVLAMTFSVFKAQIDRGAEKYESISRKRAEAINKRWERLRKANETLESNSIQMDTNEYISIQKNTSASNNNPNPKPNPQNKKESEKKKEVAASAAALLEERKEDFYKSLVPFVPIYGKDMVRDFFNYWSEANRSKTRMRFEQQPTWETSRRLATWSKKDNSYGHGTNRQDSTPESRANEVADIIARRIAEDDAARRQVR
jgi:hypothetical protein